MDPRVATAILVATLLSLAACTSELPTPSSPPAELEQRRAEFDALVAQLRVPDKEKIELLALKHGLPPSAVNDFVTEFQAAFPEFSDPLQVLAQEILGAAPDKSAPRPSVTETVQTLASRYGLPVNEVAAIIVDYDVWADCAQR